MFELPGCLQGDTKTIVVVENTLCQTVPEAELGGYKITCNADNAGGTISFCDNNLCNDGECATATPFVNGDCLPNPAVFGARSVILTCQQDNIVPQVQPQAGEVVITYHELPQCELLHETTVVAPQTICHTVPGAIKNGGYKVTCDAQGGAGTFQVCDKTCETCGVNTPFANAQECVPNPPQFGSASINFNCGAQRETGGDGGIFRIRWYENANCPNSALTGTDPLDHRTIVAGETGLCQRVPDSNKGYLVTCNAGAQGGGQISFCDDITCGNCQTQTAFTENQCLANQIQYGGLSFDVSCKNTDVPTNIQDQVLSTDVAIVWFEEAGCGGPHSSLVLAPRDTCHLVPNADTPAAFTGYKVTCNANGGGTFSVCDSTTCGNCPINTPFDDNTCLGQNPLTTGAASVRFVCGTNTNSTNGGGGGNPISAPGNSTSSSAAGYALSAAAGLLGLGAAIVGL